MSDVFGSFPQLPGTPIEKLKAERNYERIEQHIRSMLSDNPSKEEVLRAFRYYDEQTRIYNDRYSRILEQWANSHRHRGLIGEDGEFWTPEAGSGPGGPDLVLGSWYMQAMDSSPYVRIAVIKGGSNVFITPILPSSGINPAWVPDGSLAIITHASGNGYSVINIDTEAIETGFPSTVNPSNANAVSVHPEGRLVCLTVGNTSPLYQILDLDLQTFETGWPSIGTNYSTNCAFSPTGQYLAVGKVSNPLLSIIDVASKTYVADLGPINGSSTSRVRGLAFSPDGQYLAVGYEQSVAPYNYFGVVDMGTLTWEVGYPAPPSRVLQVAWSPDGTKIFRGYESSPHYDIVNFGDKTIDTGWPSIPNAARFGSWHWSGDRLAISHNSGSLLTVVDTSSKAVEGGWSAPTGGGRHIFAWDHRGSLSG